MTVVDNSILEYRADTLGTIRTLLAGYSGGITIVREMAQNTDDVPGDGDRWLEFHFNRDALVIKNSTTFREIDFTNIIKIARGGKKQEQRSTIGMFGVGFVSVFQLTDAPILRSSGCELRFVPADEQVYQSVSDVIHHTEFELPYRRQCTKVGDELGMPEVSTTWIQDTLEKLPDEAYRLLFFLRRLNRIAVYQDGTCIRDVHRSVVSPAVAGQPEIIEITSVEGNGQRTTDRWLRFTNWVLETHEGEAIPKDRLVQIVIPDHDVPSAWWLDRSAGRLYNYLPTDIETQLPFQINGDFYPSTDRKSIDNDHPNHAAWNNRVLHAVGDCLATALPILLHHFAAEPLALYQRLPIKQVAAIATPIQERFVVAARPLPIFYTVSGWQPATETRWVERALRPVADRVDPRLMPAPLQNAAWELIRRLGVQEYTLADFLQRLAADLRAGQQLTDGPWYFQTQAHVELVYTVLEQEFARRHDSQIARTPIFVDQIGRLWTADQCVYESRAEIREALTESGLHFWSGNPRIYPHINELVPEFKLHRLWEILRRQLSSNMLLANAPSWLNSPTKLYRLYDTIIKTHEPIERISVAQIPLCLNRFERLCRPSAIYMPEGEPRLYDIFEEDPDTSLVAKATQERRQYRRLYEEFGVRIFDWQMVLERLSKLARQPALLGEAHRVLNTQDKLLRIYRYLLDHRTSFERKHIEELRHRMPIWLCRSGRLQYAKDLTLPPATNDWPKDITVDRVFISTQGLGPLLTDTLGLEPLDARTFIQRHLIPQYPHLTRPQQINALKYLRGQQDVIANDRPLAQTLHKTPLLYGDDDLLHCPSELCFPAQGLRELFPDHLRLLHQTYTAGTTHPKDSQWYGLFTLLGVHLLAPASVIEAQIKTLIQRPPSETGERIEAIFRYIERYWEHTYAAVGLAAKLRILAWLPAENDSSRWYRPSELYPIQQKRLVDRVAKVLGFKHAQRPHAAVAHALDFRMNVEPKLVVRQLLRLSELGEPASKEIYRFLGQESVSRDDLKPLQGQAVMYDEHRQRYWKTDHIFLTNQKREFGSYRLSLVESELKPLLKKLNVRETPGCKDYVDVIHEISASQVDQLGSAEAQIVRNAYVALAEAPDDQLMSLRMLPCVLSRADSEMFALRLPQQVVLRPPDRFEKYLPTLPIAQYDPEGLTTLLRIGVRSIEEVLETDFRLAKDRSRSFPISLHFGRLNHAIKRLLLHVQQQKRETDIIERLTKLRAYTMPAIQVMYHVRLGNEVFNSELLNQEVYYDPESQEVFLQQSLKDQKLAWALAQVLEQVLNIDGIAPSLLKDLIAHPEQIRETLDKNHIQPLPDELEIAPIDERPDTFSLGTALEGTPEEVFVPPAPAPAIRSDQPTQRNELAQQSRFDLPVVSQSAAAPPTIHQDDSLRLKSTAHTQHITPKSRANDAHRPRTDLGTEPRPTTASNDPRARLTHLSNTSGRLAKTPVHTQGALPELHPQAPVFTGRAQRSSPTIATDIDGLRERVRLWAQERDLSTTNSQLSKPTLVSRTHRHSRTHDIPTERNAARFILSFPERTEGFLRIIGQARDLFADRPTRVTCVTEYNHSFDVWFNWQRTVPIAYNQEALPAFFEEQEIPAGGIIYLERIHSDRYRLFYQHVPHTVREVRIATNDQGMVRYDILEEVEVQCETDETIYRAEKRHEDQPALWLEAANKKSVAETLCDLFMASSEHWLHQDDLAAMLGTMRMVAASTVHQELKKQPFFETDNQGNWQLVPASLLAPSQNEVVSRWVQATQRLLGSDDALLETTLESIRPALDELRRRILRLETTTPHVSIADDVDTVVASVNENIGDTLAAHHLAQAIRERINAGDADLRTDGSLREIFLAASTDVWAQVVRPSLHQACEELRLAGEYERVAQLAQHWADFDSAHGLDLQQAVRDAEAWRILSGPEPTTQEILDAIKLAPTLTLARTKLHTTVQKALQQYPAEHWRTQGHDMQAVAAFYVYIATLAPARAALQQDHQIAFDRTVQLEADKLWQLLGNHGRLHLVLQLRHYARTARLANHQLKHLLQSAVYELPRNSISSLLLGLAAWKLCPSDSFFRGAIAEHLARCYIDLDVPELTNNRPWRSGLREQTIADIRAKCDRFRATHLQREQAFVTQLDTWEHAYRELLDEVWQELRQLVVRDIEVLATSAA